MTNILFVKCRMKKKDESTFSITTQLKIDNCILIRHLVGLSFYCFFRIKFDSSLLRKHELFSIWIILLFGPIMSNVYELQKLTLAASTCLLLRISRSLRLIKNKLFLVANLFLIWNRKTTVTCCMEASAVAPRAAPDPGPSTEGLKE